VWAVLLAVVASKASHDKIDAVMPVFSGWVLGWLSATIARVVYPPPKVRKPVDAQR
jgi:hypothetical protein